MPKSPREVYVAARESYERNYAELAKAEPAPPDHRTIDGRVVARVTMTGLEVFALYLDATELRRFMAWLVWLEDAAAKKERP